MKRTCPLPIDWLNFIEGQGDAELERHLESCLSCQALVTALREEAAGDELGDWLSRVDLDGAVTFQPKKIERPSFGDFVLSALSYSDGDISYEGLDRLVFVVLDDGEERSGHLWFRVAPADTDVENATSTDLVLRPSETELATSWRVLFAHQSRLNAAQLDESVGALTDVGKETLRQALTGALADERFGTELEGPSDPRLVADKPTEELMRTLRAPYFALEADQAPEEEAAAMLEGLRSAVVSTAEHEADVVPFKRLHGYIQSLLDANLPAAMAAAMPSSEDASFWRLESQWGEITGAVSYDFDGDRLFFVIQELSDFIMSREIAVIVWSHGRERRVESPPFRPRRGEAIVLADKQGFPDFEVGELEAKVR